MALGDFSLRPCDAIQLALSRINANRKGIVLVLDEEGRLVGTITDGDIRRALLAGLKLSDSVALILERKAGSSYAQPVVARAGTPPGELLRAMHERSVLQIPLLDESERVVDVVTMDELLPKAGPLPLRAVIMAGGQGTRLRPLTEDLPKPMLPVGDRPLMEHIVDQLREAGIVKVNVTTHYLADRITDHFGDGRQFGVEIEYVSESEPLGTAGSLSLLHRMEQPLLVINGDILTRVDFRAMLAFHREHAADLTVGVRKYDVHVPYGVVECEGELVTSIVEKPVYSFFVNAGLYLLEPAVHDLIPAGERSDMPQLIERMQRAGRRVVSFPILEYWLDIGKLQDYQQAQEDVKQWQRNP